MCEVNCNLSENGCKARVGAVTEMLKKIIAADNKGGKTWDINSEGEYTKTSTIHEHIKELTQYIAHYTKLEIIDEAKEISPIFHCCKF